MNATCAAVALLAVLAVAAKPAAADGGRATADLNGLKMVIDEHTGAILRLDYPGVGTLLDCDPAEASVVDLAYPLPDFEPLRLAPRFSTGAQVTSSAGHLAIHWPALGASRNRALKGTVSATVEFRAEPRGRDIVAVCEIHNDTDRPVPQVLFPDFSGLLPIAGPDHTIFKTGGFGSAPFRELKLSESDEFYAESNAFRAYKSGGMFSDMWMRWMDLGGLNGGISLFPRLWGWDARSSVLLHLGPTTGKLRLMCVQPVTIAPGKSWRSEEWVITPHRNGWAKGIEPYREFARAHFKRSAPVPTHVSEGLGFRSAWMCTNQPNDPERDPVWRFRDLPALAREAHEHGLDEMVLWSTHPGFTLPQPKPFPHLGTEAEFAQAVADCRKLGVNVAPFISVLQANKATGARYGMQVPDTGGWTYHPEMIPRFNPPYAGAYACAQVDTANPKWQADVLDFAKHLADIGIPSVSWDQFWTSQAEPNIQTLSAAIRAYARTKDPQATLSGEELWNIEVDCEYLDYTWNWGGYRDCQAYTNVFPSPRHNININRSVWEVKRGFLDGLYLNVWPAKPGGVNGSDWIHTNEALSQALKRCAKMRARFVQYFTEGAFIGNCVLTEECPGVHVAARALPDRVLILLTNEGAARDVTLHYDLSPWSGTPAGEWTLKLYDAEGERSGRQLKVPGGAQTLTLKGMQNLETRACEFVAEGE